MLKIALGENYTSKQGKYPVIFITLKDIESNNFDKCYEGLKSKIANVFKEHREILVSLEPDDQIFYNDVLFERASQSNFELAIGNLIYL